MRNRGFTLIELVVVIVILGVLAVTAAPRFLGMTTDAKNASLSGLKGAIESSIQMGKSKLAMDGLESKKEVWSPIEPKLQAWCDLCYFNYGAPGNVLETWKHLMNGVDKKGTEDFKVGVLKAGSPESAFSTPENFKGTELNTDNCYIKYTPPAIDGSEDYKLELVECK